MTSSYTIPQQPTRQNRKSFRHAIEGLRYVLSCEATFDHIVAAVLVVALSAWLRTPWWIGQ